MNTINNKTIMLVEDDPVQLDLINTIIKKIGFQTITARSGYDAIHQLKLNKTDLVITDLHMPDMTGFHLLKNIKEGEDTKQIPVLMMSIDSSDESAILCFSCGADGYINKPIRLSELFLNIKKTINVDIANEEAVKLYSSLRAGGSESYGPISPDMLNFVFGGEEYQEASSKCTFASILCIRIQGLTSLVNQVGSEKIQGIFDEIISSLSQIIYKNRGAINAIANDLILCTFGIPVVYDNDTMNALLCAEEIKKYDLNLAKLSPDYVNIRLKISTAIMSGKIYHGAVRALQKLNDSIIGMPMKRALNLESFPESESKYIIIDKNTREVIKPYTELETVSPDDLPKCFESEELFRVISLNQEKIKNIPNFKKQYTPKDSVSDEGYAKI